MIGEPTVSITDSTSSSKCLVIASTMRVIARLRSAGVRRGHGPTSNARRAAAIAASTCAGLAAGIRQTTSSVAGLTVSRTSSPAPSCHWPSMKTLPWSNQWVAVTSSPPCTRMPNLYKL